MSIENKILEGLVRVEQKLDAVLATVQLLVDAIVDAAAADADPGLSLDGPANGAERDQTQPL